MTPSVFGPPGTRLGAFVLVWILAWLPAAPAFAAKAKPLAELVMAGSFVADGITARERKIPIMVFYTRDDCSWCERVRRQHLLPLANDPASAGRVLIREVSLDTDFDTALTDFGGRTTTHSAFARTRRVRLTPTLDFLDDRGHRLAESIVGVRLPDFHGVFIERAIDESLAKLRNETK